MSPFHQRRAARLLPQDVPRCSGSWPTCPPRRHGLMLGTAKAGKSTMATQLAHRRRRRPRPSWATACRAVPVLIIERGEPGAGVSSASTCELAGRAFNHPPTEPARHPPPADAARRPGPPWPKSGGSTSSSTASASCSPAQWPRSPPSRTRTAPRIQPLRQGHQPALGAHRCHGHGPAPPPQARQRPRHRWIDGFFNTSRGSSALVGAVDVGLGLERRAGRGPRATLRAAP